ncbi:acyltransferase family protein [Sphingobacterium bambusae]|uniref:Acyltransferase family protein n=1 Tax=Sphingobacterium bambusae TaxID=662858 RepID=A0ABW6BDF6_9SPHI|nr:acyltransferase [Sphingobacterium bambusae]WPL46885.1 acyltransferase [Sphingobacterium bambusae]
MILDNRNIKQLDGIRGLSILIVFFSHLGLGHLVPGGFGVTVFFFISGFLISKLLIYEFEQSKTLNFKNFYIRRAFRLYPALLFFSSLVILLLIFHDVRLIPSQIVAALMYFENYYYVYFINYQEQHQLYSIFKILWSLSIEEHYYLFYPLFLFLTYSRVRLHLVLTVLFLIIPLLFRLYYVEILVDPKLYEKYNYSLTHTRIDSILYGSLLAYLLFKDSRGEKILEFLQKKWLLVLSLAVLLFTFVYREDSFRETYRYTLQGIFLTPVIVFAVYGDQSLLNKLFFTNKVFVYIGKLSYSIYLFHWLAIPLATLYFTKFGLQWQLFVLAVTISLSLFSYYRVEMPFVKLRKKFGSNV